jgi:mitochondrial fission protein ELM1
MKQQMHEIRERTAKKISVDISSVPSQDRKYSRLKNKSQVFDDRRKRKPKYKPNYMED